MAKVTAHRFLPEGITQIEQDTFNAANMVMAGRLPGGLDTDVKEENEEDLNGTELPKEFEREVEVF